MEIFTRAQQNKSHRIMLVVLLCLALAVVAFVIGLVFVGLTSPESLAAEGWVLAALVGGFFVIMAPFTPFMPIWPLVVRDDTVWMVFSGGLFSHYVGPGTHWLPPIQDFRRYEHRGLILVIINGEVFTTRDDFPYRVSVNVVCLHNPMNAERTMWTTINDMNQQSMRMMLETGVRYAVRDHLSRHTRASMNLERVKEEIRQEIEKAIGERRSFGIILSQTRPISISLEPTQEAIEGRVEAQRLEALVNLADQYGLTPGELERLSLVAHPDRELPLQVASGALADLLIRRRELEAPITHPPRGLPGPIGEAPTQDHYQDQSRGIRTEGGDYVEGNSIQIGPYNVFYVTQPAPLAATDPTALIMAVLHLLIGGESTGFDSGRFAQVLSQFMNIGPETIHIRRVFAGSVWVELEMPLQAAQELYDLAARRGLLHKSPKQEPAAETPSGKKEGVHLPPNPVGPKRKDEVIDTEVDSEGVHVPKNPTGPVE